MSTLQNAQPEVSIIILNWNGLEDTIECLESLKQISYLNYKVIIVDNGSEKDEAKILKERFGDYIRIIQEASNNGFGRGANIGMKYAMANFNPNYLMILNNDTVIDKNCVTELVKLTESDISTGIAGCKIYNYDSPDSVQCIGAKINTATGHTRYLDGKHVDSKKCNQPEEVDMVIACILLKSSMVHDIGFYNEKYFIYYDDTDFCVRARKKGYKIKYSPDAKIWHKSGHTAAKVTGLTDYYITRNRIWFVKNNVTKAQYLKFIFRYFFSLSLYLKLAGLIYHRKTKEFIANYRGIKDGFLNSDSSSKFYR